MPSILLIIHSATKTGNKWMGFIYIHLWLTLASQDSWKQKASVPSPIFWAQFQVGLLDWAGKGKQHENENLLGEGVVTQTALTTVFEWSLPDWKKQWAASVASGETAVEASMSLPVPHVAEKTLGGLPTLTANSLLYLTAFTLISLIQLPTPWFVVALSSLALPHISFHNSRHSFSPIHTHFGFYF